MVLTNARILQVSGLKKHYHGRWEASITHEGKTHYLGLFDKPEAALASRNQKAQELGFGQYMLPSE